MVSDLVRWNDLNSLFQIRYFRYVNKAKNPYFKGAFMVLFSGSEFEIRHSEASPGFEIWGPPAVNFGSFN